MSTIKFHQDLKVFQKSVEFAMIIFELTKSFPKEELYSYRSNKAFITIRFGKYKRSLGKRKYEKSFVAKLTDSEGEARETQTWLLYAWKCKYINEEQFISLNKQYNQIIGMLVNMMSQSGKWCSFSQNKNE
jgi:hypothetical protein